MPFFLHFNHCCSICQFTFFRFIFSDFSCGTIYSWTLITFCFSDFIFREQNVFSDQLSCDTILIHSLMQSTFQNPKMPGIVAFRWVTFTNEGSSNPPHSILQNWGSLKVCKYVPVEVLELGGLNFTMTRLVAWKVYNILGF